MEVFLRESICTYQNSPFPQVDTKCHQVTSNRVELTTSYFLNLLPLFNFLLRK